MELELGRVPAQVNELCDRIRDTKKKKNKEIHGVLLISFVSSEVAPEDRVYGDLLLPAQEEDDDNIKEVGLLVQTEERGKLVTSAVRVSIFNLIEGVIDGRFPKIWIVSGSLFRRERDKADFICSLMEILNINYSNKSDVIRLIITTGPGDEDEPWDDELDKIYQELE